MAHSTDKKTGTDAEVLAFIHDHVRDKGYPPSVREIGNRWDVVPSSVHKTLQRMQREGLIQRPPGVSRGLRISEAGMKLISSDPTLHG